MTDEFEKDYMKSLLVMMINHREFILKHMLTDRQVEIVEFVKEQKKVGSVDVSIHFKISVQCASQLLKRCWEKDYLERKDIQHLTGGNEYEYSYALFG